jgi:hypothetical protein
VNRPDARRALTNSAAALERFPSTSGLFGCRMNTPGGLDNIVVVVIVIATQVPSRHWFILDKGRWKMKNRRRNKTKIIAISLTVTDFVLASAKLRQT